MKTEKLATGKEKVGKRGTWFASRDQWSWEEEVLRYRTQAKAPGPTSGSEGGRGCK